MDGGGVMLLDIGGGEVYADLLMLSADRVRTGGGVEGTSGTSRTDSFKGLAMMTDGRRCLLGLLDTACECFTHHAQRHTNGGEGQFDACGGRSAVGSY